MTKRVCLEPGCPTLTDTGRCTTHRRAADQARGTRTERGYGPDHIRLRQAWQDRIDDGEHVTCWRPGCGAPITGTSWHLGHDDDDRTMTRGPECAACNLRAAGAKTAGR